MKKLLPVLMLFFVTGMYVNETHAQILPEFGIRGGTNFASFSDSKQEVDSRRIGLLAGIYGIFKIPVIPISIQPEVLYSQKGANINGVDVNLSYIEIPLLVRLDFAKNNLLSPHIYAGPYIGFNIDADEDPPGDLEPAKDRVDKTDTGITFGAGLDVYKINVGIRYSLGLEEIFENEELRNNAISIVFGFNF